MRVHRAAIAAMVVGTAAAAQPAQPAARPEAFQALTRCRAIQADAERFACLERSAAALEDAAARGEIVIVDRQKIRETKQTLFGLSLPRIDLFGGDTEEVRRVDGVVASANRDADGRWQLTLEGGARWQQIDDRPLGRSPRAGDKVAIERATMGSFMMKIRGHPGIRVRRLS